MIYGKEKLLESLGQRGWNFDERDQEVQIYNELGDRRLTYLDHGEGFGGEFISMGLSFLNSGTGWSEVFRMHYMTPGDIETMAFDIWTAGDQAKGDADKSVYYSTRGIRGYGATSLFRGKISQRVLEDRKELLYDLAELPTELDYEMTANLFVEQLTRGEMIRPVLVPKDLFKYEEPVDLAPGTKEFSQNLNRAARLLARARTDEEFRAAERIYQWVAEQETDVRLGI